MGRDNVIVLTSPIGGIGLSIFGAMLSWELRRREKTCAMVDADLHAGGLDVLLGIEGNEGLRFGSLDAPLGIVDGKSLDRDLPRWEDVGILACNPWNGNMPDWWEVQAAICALAEVNDVVVVDAADGAILDAVPALAQAWHVMAVELSVLGLGRAKAHMERFGMRGAADCEGAGRNDDGTSKVVHSIAGQRVVNRNTMDRKEWLSIVGMRPHGLRGAAGSLSVDEAADYLSCDVIGPVRSSRRLRRSVLEGAGIQRIGRGSAGCVRLLAGRIEALLAQGARS
ncbi:MAG: cobalamin biosynthesis protein CobQ [Bifidobacterium sp.]|nr:cobalamin biosynthesis protein CobQ [Bifidobacterium sp.]